MTHWLWTHKHERPHMALGEHRANAEPALPARPALGRPENARIMARQAGRGSGLSNGQHHAVGTRGFQWISDRVR